MFYAYEYILKRMNDVKKLVGMLFWGIQAGCFGLLNPQ